jgi:hypothetical protein
MPRRARGSETEDRDAAGIALFRTHAKMIPPVQSPIAKTEPIQLDDGKRGSLEFVSRMSRLSSALLNVVQSRFADGSRLVSARLCEARQFENCFVR